MNRITLCGSTKFKKAFMEWNAKLTLEGNIVYSVAMWSHSAKIEPTPEQKIHLDKVHFAKIDNSDEIFVLDVGGYIGESTKNEIIHAIKTGKNVRFLSNEYPNWNEDQCSMIQGEKSLEFNDRYDIKNVIEYIEYMAEHILICIKDIEALNNKVSKLKTICCKNTKINVQSHGNC